MTRQVVKKVPGARKVALPKFIAPQLATLVKEPPPGDQWLHELKFDGYRMLCRIDRGKVQFWSRNGKDWTAKFPGIAEVVKSLPVTSAIIDGEIVVVGASAAGPAAAHSARSKQAAAACPRGSHADACRGPAAA